ncbi:acyl carrier protein [Amycolatopsis aidingensis]|uniref:acyl carrier protein n=1 Tax=Amycolatopsis aidingensis TaxID=2842453 RepID=UPI001C0C0CF9|nr:acyl carrier protein [Amycolatopsis aidingensis]
MVVITDDQKQQVKSIICDILEIEPNALKEADSFVDDHDADSLLAIEILAKLETTLGVTIDQSELSRMTTLENVYVVLAEVSART